MTEADRLGVASLPTVVPAVIVGSWVVALGLQAAGWSGALHHDQLLDAGITLPLALGAFLLAWQLHVAAMMLPTAVPMLALFWKAAARQPAPGRALAGFLAGYALVWTGFGAGALVGDAELHQLVEGLPWLSSNRGLVLPGVLAVAGAFQFSSLKDRCLTRCRNPAIFLLRSYRRGAAPAFGLGLRHGAICLGCCWALMLVLFTVGVASMAWMAPLTAVMVYEKVGRHGRALARLVGGGLVAIAAVVVVA